MIFLKIKVILTGGTIGSVYSDGYITPNLSNECILVNNYKNNHNSNIEFVVENPYTILSENLTGNVLNNLVSEIKKSLNEGYDGIIVAHGTDTLQYSAVAAHYCLGSDTIPIMFVSANYPLENTLSNGNINFEAAVEFISQKVSKGVFVSYSNDLKTVQFHLPTRLLRHGEYDHKLFSLNGEYANYESGKITVVSNRTMEETVFKSSKTFSNTCEILNITASPFDEYNYSLDGIKTVVFTPYHSGTLNTESDKFKEFCQKASEKSAKMYVTGISKGGEYASMKAYSDLNIIPVFDIPSIPLLVKLWLEK